MLSLIYRTGLFGPLRFEYTKRYVRVGSCRDNDLVLPHPSVQAYHCTLVMEDDWLAVLGPHADEGATLDGAQVLRVGDRLPIGEVTLEVERSPNSVGLPPTGIAAPPMNRTAEGYWIVGGEDIPNEARWCCASCQLRFEDGHVRTIGLAGRRRHVLCPVCHQHLVGFRPTSAAPRTFAAKVRHWRNKLVRALGF